MQNTDGCMSINDFISYSTNWHKERCDWWFRIKGIVEKMGNDTGKQNHLNSFQATSSWVGMFSELDKN